MRTNRMVTLTRVSVCCGLLVVWVLGGSATSGFTGSVVNKADTHATGTVFPLVRPRGVDPSQEQARSRSDP